MANVVAPPFVVPRPPSGSDWNGTPLAAALALLATAAQPFFNSWQSYSVDQDTRVWQWQAPLNRGLLSPPGTPFVNVWPSSYEPDKVWSWSAPYNLALPLAPPLTIYQWRLNVAEDVFWPAKPQASAVLAQLLTAAGQPPQAHWNFGYDEPPAWRAASIAPNLNLAEPSASITPAPAWFWRVDIAEDPPWLGKPTAAPFNLLGGQVPTKFWRYDYVETPVWTWTAPQSAVLAPLLTAGGQPPTPRWQPLLDSAASAWQWQAPPNLPLSTPTVTLPFYNPWQAGTVDQDVRLWLGVPINSAAIPLLTAQKVYAAGGQVPTFFFVPIYDLSPAYWQSGSQPVPVVILGPLPPIPPPPPPILPTGGGGHRKPVRPIWDIQRELDAKQAPGAAPDIAPDIAPAAAPIEPKAPSGPGLPLDVFGGDTKLPDAKPAPAAKPKLRGEISAIEDHDSVAASWPVASSAHAALVEEDTDTATAAANQVASIAGGANEPEDSASATCSAPVSLRGTAQDDSDDVASGTAAAFAE
jgi:hypothetical protein